MAVDPLQVKIEMISNGQVALIHLNGNLDAHTFETLQEHMSTLFDNEQFRIIVDLSHVGYMSSAGAGVLIGAMSQTQSNDGMLVLSGCNDGVLQVLNVLGLNNVFPLSPDVQTALRAF